MMYALYRLAFWLNHPYVCGVRWRRWLYQTASYLRHVLPLDIKIAALLGRKALKRGF